MTRKPLAAPEYLPKHGLRQAALGRPEHEDSRRPDLVPWAVWLRCGGAAVRTQALARLHWKFYR